jgi:hypothetical protein
MLERIMGRGDEGKGKEEGKRERGERVKGYSGRRPVGKLAEPRPWP